MTGIDRVLYGLCMVITCMLLSLADTPSNSYPKGLPKPHTQGRSFHISQPKASGLALGKVNTRVLRNGYSSLSFHSMRPPKRCTIEG